MATLQEHQAVLLELLQEFDRICKKHDIAYSLFAGTALGAIRHGGFIPWDDDLDVVMLRPDYERFLRIAPEEVSDTFYVQGEFSENWPLHFSKLRKNNTTCLEKYKPKFPDCHQGIYIDIFPCDNAADSRAIQLVQYLSARLAVARDLERRGYETNSRLKRSAMRLCGMLPLKPFHAVAVRREDNQSKSVHTFFGGSCRFRKGIYPRKWIEEVILVPFEHLQVPISAHYDELLKTLYGNYLALPPEDERKCKVHALLVDTERPYTDYRDYRKDMEFEVYTRSIR